MNYQFLRLEGVVRVVVIPKFDSAVASLSTSSTELGKAARASRLKDLRKRRTGSEVKSAIKNTVTAAKDHGFETFTTPANSQLPVTGAIFLESNKNSISELAADLPEYHVVPDYELSLIPPTKSARSKVKAANDLDLWHLEQINVLAARKHGFKGTGQDITVAVADTGIKKVNEIRGRVDRAIELDVPGNQWKEVPTHDTDGHGTHVAGLIAGSNVGVAPAAKLVNVLMIPDGRGHLSDFILAIEYTAQSPDIAILNMSAGIRGYYPEMLPAISALIAVACLPVIAVGNEGRNTSRSPGNYSEVISVGASNAARNVSNFSGGGKMIVQNMSYPIPDLVAPGEGVYSCVMNGGYEAWDGTSMATPIVSGLAALVIEQHPKISLADLEQSLLDSCISLGAPVERQGAGLAQLPTGLWMPAV